MITMFRAFFGALTRIFLSADEGMTFVHDRSITLAQESEVDLIIDTAKAQARKAAALKEYQLSDEMLQSIADRRSGKAYRK